MTRNDLEDCITAALRASGDSAHWVQIAKYIWGKYEADLRASGDLFFTWQYEIRWAMQRLRDQGRVRNVGKGIWRLT